MPLQESIPHELILNIILRCDYLSILRFASTCKLYRNLAAGSSVIQLQLELEANGFQLSDEAYRTKTEATALQLLDEFKRYRDGWLYLRLGTAPRLVTMDPSMRLYELRQGSYVAALSGTPDSPGDMKLRHLSTGATHVLNPCLRFNEFQIDPSQDLLVLVNIQRQALPLSTIHFRSVKSGGLHDGTHHPDWEVIHTFLIDIDASDIFIDISGDLLVVQFVSFRRMMAEILIWDWKRSLLLNRIECSGVSRTFGFLTSDSILLFQSTGTASPAINLLIYDNIRTPRTSSDCDHSGRFVVSEYEPLSPRLIFEFPALLPNTNAFLLLRGEPGPTVTSSGFSPFLPLPETRVFQLSLTVAQISAPANPLTYYQIFISKKKLLEHISSFDDQVESSQDPIRIPWATWGEYSTRWFVDQWSTRPWLYKAYGTRAIRSSPFTGDENGTPREHISILDFHAPTVRRFSSLGRDAHLSLYLSKDARHHIDLHTSIDHEDYRAYILKTAVDGLLSDQDERVFVDTVDENIPSLAPFCGAVVQTRLPYRIVTRVRPFTCHPGWMMDNNSLIGMPGGPMDDHIEDIHHGKIHVYTPYVRKE